jgi:hypothetical protein
VSGSTIVVYRVLLMLALVGIAAAAMRRSLRVAPRGARPAVVGLEAKSTTTLIGVCYLSPSRIYPRKSSGRRGGVLHYPVVIVLATP